jgi:negative regulator of sigma-B (phosphoserine phosphatase)
MTALSRIVMMSLGTGVRADVQRPAVVTTRVRVCGPPSTPACASGRVRAEFLAAAGQRVNGDTVLDRCGGEDVRVARRDAGHEGGAAGRDRHDEEAGGLSVDTALLEWGVAARPIAGERVSGDASHVEVRDGEALLVGIDGLGHGRIAATAAAATLAAVREDPWAPIEAIVERCHRKIAHTRGVALSLVRIFATGRLTWIGVGNVDCLLVRAADGRREAAPLRGGVVGHRLPALRVNEVSVAPGDLVLITSDGIASAYADKVVRVGAVQQLADDILQRHGRRHDDVMVLVARYLGPG